MEKWVNGRLLSVSVQSLQNLGLKGNINYLSIVSHIFISFKHVFDITVVQVVADHCKICLNCSN